MNLKEQQSLLVIGMLLCLWLSLVSVMTVWTDAEVDWVAAKMKEEPVDIHWGWSAAIVVLPVTAPFALPFNIGCEIYAAFEGE
jgi:hypothetical protein